jgi:hypothetical protein
LFFVSPEFRTTGAPSSGPVEPSAICRGRCSVGYATRPLTVSKQSRCSPSSYCSARPGQCGQRRVASLHVDGLTNTYNQLKDPAATSADLLALRHAHEELDRAVFAAYGWRHIAVPAYCRASAEQLEAFEDEAFDRSFALNAERAKPEELRGAGAVASRKGTKRSSAGSTSGLPLVCDAPSSKAKRSTGKVA